MPLRTYYKLALVAFLIGYILASILLYIAGGVAPITPEYKEKPMTFLNALNPFEPMSPAVYMIIFGNK